MSERKEQKERKLKVAVVRENLLAVVGGKDAIKAMILNQLLFWHDHVTQKDQHLLELIEAYEEAGDKATAKALEAGLSNGWFWKSAKKLAKELMFVDRTTVTKKLKALEEEGFISSRPGERPDLPKHYKVNIGFLKKKLWELGYTLDGFVEDQPPVGDPVTKSQGEQTIPCDNITTPVTKSQPLCSDHIPCDEITTPVTKSQLSRLHIDYNKDYKEDYKEQQQQLEEESVVVVAQKAVKEKFDYELTEKHIKNLLELAQKEKVDLFDMIDNTYEFYKATNQICENPYGAIKHAITSGGYTIPRKKQSNLPKSMREQPEEQEKLSPEEIAEKKRRIQEMIKNMDSALSNRKTAP